MRLAAVPFILQLQIMVLLCVASSLRTRASAAFTTSLLQHNLYDAATHNNHQQQCRTFALSHHQKKKHKLAEQRRCVDQPPQMKSGPKKIKNRPSLLRADRVLSNRGWGSRSECFELLKQKRVTTLQRDHGEDKVVTISGPSDRLRMNATLWVDGNKPVPLIPLLLAYHKPKWVLSVMHDPQGRPCLDKVLPDHYQNQDLHPVGRLDYDTSGLLLFSSNGALTQKLLHPSHEVPKQYMAVVEDVVDENKLRGQLEAGVETTEGTHTAELVDVVHFSDTESQEVWKTMRAALPPEYNVTDLEERGYLPSDGISTPTKLLSQVRIIVREGKHRMVRRMLANCGHGVVELKREQQGEIILGDELPLNEFRNLTDAEEDWAQSLIPRSGKKKGKK
jgi:23S rRNA pseudouridine2605 synthase